MQRADTPEYRRAYERGWRASGSTSDTSLDRALGRGEPDAWFDGYMDRGCGRKKWHTRDCPDHDSCP